MPHIPTALHLRPDQLSAVAFGVAATLGLTAYLLYNRRQTPEEIERQRREFLATRGRITDATLVDTGLERRGDASPSDLPAEVRHEDALPEVLRYQYKVGGVGYESLQDVVHLSEYVRHLRVDLPIQVRYDPKNPGNSIVVAESWSGLRVGLGSSVGVAIGNGLDQRIRSGE